MIPGTSYSPSKAFISFAREFFERVAAGNYGAALGKLDSTAKRWTKSQLLALINTASGNLGLSSCQGITQSASPTMIEESDDVYVLTHRLPIAGKWASAKAVFRFSRKAGTEYFHVELQNIEL